MLVDQVVAVVIGAQVHMQVVLVQQVKAMLVAQAPELMATVEVAVVLAQLVLKALLI
jgi:hypothetical protein